MITCLWSGTIAVSLNETADDERKNLFSLHETIILRVASLHSVVCESRLFVERLEGDWALHLRLSLRGLSSLSLGSSLSPL